MLSLFSELFSQDLTEQSIYVFNVGKMSVLEILNLIWKTFCYYRCRELLIIRHSWRKIYLHATSKISVSNSRYVCRMGSFLFLKIQVTKFPTNGTWRSFSLGGVHRTNFYEIGFWLGAFFFIEAHSCFRLNDANNWPFVNRQSTTFSHLRRFCHLCFSSNILITLIFLLIRVESRMQ